MQSTTGAEAPFRTAAVLGAGVMGAQIAAHLANAGLDVELLDMPAPEGPKNAQVEALFARACKLKPAPFFLAKNAGRIRLGNFEEHWDRLAEVDWVVEVVIENMDIKRDVLGRLDGVVRPDAVISTNTSGLPIAELSVNCSPEFRARFLGTHFFNPPRYMKLLELVPTPETSPDVLARVRHFGRVHLGKGTVVAKDTPNFIANRIGVFAILQTIRRMTEGGYSYAEVDALTGPLTGRPKSATLRTCDVVGLDTLAYVAQNLYGAVPDDESREAFVVPPVLAKLIENGSIGAKVKRGFYQKQGRKILSFDPETNDYVEAPPPDLGDLGALKKAGDTAARMRALFADTGRAGRLFRAITVDMLAYSARRVPEITDSPADLDRAIRWGFGYEMGPFETWDALGFEAVRGACKEAGESLPGWIDELAAVGGAFYREVDGAREVWTPDAGYQRDESHEDEVDLAVVKRRDGGVIWENDHAGLLDLGDGVALFEFRSKANTLTTGVMAALGECLDRVEQGLYRGMVIGNGAEHFSPGANLAEMAGAVQQGQFQQIDGMIRRFQDTVQRVHYSSVPVVVAVRGRVFGGACELVMASRHPVAAAESYIGLVEVGAGLIPAGCGTMRMARWAADQAVSRDDSAILPWLRRAFETVGKATVATSAHEALDHGFLAPGATIVAHADRHLHVAKTEVLRLAAQGYAPPARRDTIRVLGEPGRAVCLVGARQLRDGGFIDESMEALVGKLAFVMTGGDLSGGEDVPESYLLDLEREVFVGLLGEPATQQRIAAILGLNKKT